MAEARLQAADDRDRKPDAHDVGSDAGNDLSSEAVEDRFVDLADRTPGSGDDPGGRRGWAVRELAAERRDRAAEERELAVSGRERAAEERDRFAAERDECAEERDQVAARGDREAEMRDRAAPSVELHLPLVARERLAARRREAASDRKRAGADRVFSSAERLYARADRACAAVDREAALGERSAMVFDDLTGAYRRGPGYVELDREVARAQRSRQPVVLAFVDVVGLKAVNDSAGHPGGDEVLRSVAEALRVHLRPYDPVVRYGGDEFVCLLAGLDLRGATRRLAAVNATLADSPGKTAVTIGLAELEAGESLEGLIARADDALYQQRRHPTWGGTGPCDRLDQVCREAGLSHAELWVRYFELGGRASPLELEAYLLGALQPATRDLDLVVHALDERLGEAGRVTAQQSRGSGVVQLVASPGP
jgi:diguanylate cyclase (GGDEF)-like protein